ncbi:MAG: threonine/serine dehydratase [Pseudomonadota bacterium]
MIEAPTLDEIRALRDALGDSIVRTPVLRAEAIESVLSNGTRVFAKLEFLQHTGTFKARGALATVHGLSADERAAGVTAVSAGCHAVATAYASKAYGVGAKIVMTASANPARVEACASYGAEIVHAGTVHEAFEMAESIRRDEGRFMVHPFDGKTIATGTGTLGLEIAEQVSEADAVIVSVGGGGLIGGVANAVRLANPNCRIYGVEPSGADSMSKSLAQGEAVSIEAVNTIADSLGAPFASEYTHAMCAEHVEAMVLVDDDELKRMMGWTFHRMKMAVEPACVAATAALFGPLRERLAGQTVVVLMCGSIMDWNTFSSFADFDAVYVD